jgi:DNA-directed RNA polymerase specialized sigma24 family protein
VRGAILDELRAEVWLPRRRQGAGRSRVVLHLDDLGPREQHHASLAEDADGEALTGRKRVVERIRAGIDRLPPRERLVLTMRDLDRRSHQGLGEALGVSVSSPRVCQSAARRCGDCAPGSKDAA